MTLYEGVVLVVVGLLAWDARRGMIEAKKLLEEALEQAREAEAQLRDTLDRNPL
jgi:hypothetical protein